MNLEDKLKPFLAIPGAGVFTVNTQKERKDLLHDALYGKTGQQAEDKWQNSLSSLKSGKEPLVLGVCSDCGGGICRGANWGPLFIRNNLLEIHRHLNYFDLGDIRVIPHLLMDKYLNEETLRNCRRALYGDPSSEKPVSPLSITAEVIKILNQEVPHRPVLSLGGDHSVSYPLVYEYLKARKAKGIRTAVIHFDAHTDLLEERLGIDICFGSWTTHVLEQLEKPSDMIQIGIRSSGKDRNHWENKFSVQQYWSGEVNKKGSATLSEEILEYLKKENIQELYISFDIDALDAKYASATGTPESGGLEPHTCIDIIKSLGINIPITGADIVEVAPFIANNSPTASAEPASTLTCAGNIAAILLELMSPN